MNLSLHMIWQSFRKSFGNPFSARDNPHRRRLQNLFTMNSKLTAERNKATFDVAELTILIDGSKENVAKRRILEKHVVEDKRFREYWPHDGQSLDSICNKSSEIAKYFNAKMTKLNLPAHFIWDAQHVNSVRSLAFASGNALSTHESLFVPTIMNQGSDEQKRKWLPLIKDQKVFGSYAQTELGHGDNVQALETTATYDNRTQEFILNSPTITSTKCFASGLGRASNHAAVVAKLLISNKNYGMHIFIVHLRSFEDHKPLKGITVGCMGSKLGFATLDNGFLILNNVRIPRENMLMKQAQVLEDGTYVKSSHAYLNYSTLSLGRVSYSSVACCLLSVAVTIAVRYSAVRQQGEIERGKPEVEIINYQTQQYKLLPHIAIAYAFMFANKELNIVYEKAATDVKLLSELHALSSGVKAVTTSVGTESAEVCRRSCGGIGYMQCSGLPGCQSSLTALCTLEGDNTVLLLQTARYLMKLLTKKPNVEQVSPAVRYLFQDLHSKNNGSPVDEVLSLYKLTASNFLKHVHGNLLNDITKGTKEEIAWNNNTIALEKSAFIHIQAFVLQSMFDMLHNRSMSDSLRQVLEYLFELAGIYWIMQNTKYVVMYGGCSGTKINELNSRIPKLLKLLRPNMVALVDAFDVNDDAMGSVTGCYDGRIYERITDYWFSLPCNRENVPPITKKANL